MPMCSDSRRVHTKPGKMDEPCAKAQQFGKSRQEEYKFYILQLTKVYFSRKQNHTSQIRMFKKKIILQKRKHLHHCFPIPYFQHILVFKVKRAPQQLASSFSKSLWKCSYHRLLPLRLLKNPQYKHV